MLLTKHKNERPASERLLLLIAFSSNHTGRNTSNDNNHSNNMNAAIFSNRDARNACWHQDGAAVQELKLGYPGAVAVAGAAAGVVVVVVVVVVAAVE